MLNGDLASLTHLESLVRKGLTHPISPVFKLFEIPMNFGVGNRTGQ